MGNSLKLKPHQQLIVNHIINTPRCAVWADMGVGKTASTLSALSFLSLLKPIKALIIAPLRVAAATWPNEVAKWAEFNHMTVSVIHGNRKQKEKALSTMANIYTINFENIPWLVETLNNKWDFNVIVVDEATKLKSFRLRKGGSRATALKQVAFKNVDHFIELTGTPSPNGLMDLWGQLWFIDKGDRLAKSFTTFKSRWFNEVKDRRGEYTIRLDPKPDAMNDIQQRVRDICITVAAKDFFDIREPIVNNIEIELPKSVKTMYQKMESALYVEFADISVQAVNAAAKTLKLIQIANGALYTEGDTWAPLHDLKLQALQEIIESANGAPVLVAYHFKSDLERLLKYFPQGKSLDKNPTTLAEWNKGKIPILFAHPASSGHGLNLQHGGNILVFFSQWWDLEQYQQIIERIGPTRQIQSGYDRPVFIYNIIAKNTVDELILERKATKKSVQDLLLNSMKKNVDKC